MLKTRPYNNAYTIGPVIFQVMLKGQSAGIAVDLLPQITLGTNHLCRFAIGTEFFMGVFNVGLMQRSYIKERKQNAETVKKQADKLGWTVKEYIGRWS